MPSTKTTYDQLENVSRPVAELVERFGFHWTFDYAYPVPDPAHRLQIRNSSNLAPTAMVTPLKEAMKRGDKIPAVVVTEDGYIIDGNTRCEAARKGGFPTVHALVLDVKYEGCRESENRRLHALGAGFNARNGKGIDRHEIQAAVDIIGSDPTYTATRIAALIGTTETTVQGYLAEKKAKERAASLELHVNGSINATKLRKLGVLSDHLNDEPFKALFSLVEDTGMSVGEIADVARRARAEKSDSGALGVFSQERQARQSQIAEYTASGKSTPPKAAMLRQRLGFILSYEGNPSELAEHNPTQAQSHIDQAERAIAVLQKMVRSQEV